MALKSSGHHVGFGVGVLGLYRGDLRGMGQAAIYIRAVSR